MKKKMDHRSLQIRVPEQLKAACLEKAAKEQMTFSEWLRNVLRKETKDVRVKSA